VLVCRMLNTHSMTPLTLASAKAPSAGAYLDDYDVPWPRVHSLVQCVALGFLALLR
jgi:hypothetical protein